MKWFFLTNFEFPQRVLFGFSFFPFEQLSNTIKVEFDLDKLLEIEWSSYFELTLTLNLTLIKSFNCRFTRTQWVGCRNSEYILRAFPTVEFTSAVQHRITTTSSKLVAPSGQFHLSKNSKFYLFENISWKRVYLLQNPSNDTKSW